MNTQKKYKDTVYRMIFGKPDKALSLYNSLNGTDGEVRTGQGIGRGAGKEPVGLREVYRT